MMSSTVPVYCVGDGLELRIFSSDHKTLRKFDLKMSNPIGLGSDLFALKVRHCRERLQLTFE